MINIYKIYLKNKKNYLRVVYFNIKTVSTHSYYAPNIYAATKISAKKVFFWNPFQLPSCLYKLNIYRKWLLAKV